MRYEPYVPNERVCRLAARLWREHMDNGPEFNQLGKPESPGYRGGDVAEEVREIMCESLVMQICAGKVTKEKLDTFEVELARLLLARFPFAGVPDGEQTRVTVEEGRQPVTTKEKIDNTWLRGMEHEHHLSVDYHPGTALRLACDKAALPHELCPIKSSVDLSRGHLCAAFGYGEARRFYYPLDAERWLVTSLYGEPEDIEKVKVLSDHFTVTTKKGC